MGLDFRAIAQDSATLTIPAMPGADKTITVTYRPNRYTLEWALAPTPLNESIVDIVESWDLMDGDQLFPITADDVKRLPLPFLPYLLTKIREDMSEGKASRSATSANGSSAGGSGGGAQTS